MREYARRDKELAEELEEARQFNDWGLQERLQERRDRLEEHVRRLRGLGGKARSFSGTFDSARTSVTNAINQTLKSDAVRAVLPEAYRHLDRAISRGAFLSYDPETPVSWAFSEHVRNAPLKRANSTSDRKEERPPALPDVDPSRISHVHLPVLPDAQPCASGARAARGEGFGRMPRI